MLCSIEKRVSKKYSRLPEESGEAFLRRLAGSISAQDDAGRAKQDTEELRSALLRLAELVEAEFYSQKDAPLQDVPDDLYKLLKNAKLSV